MVTSVSGSGDPDLGEGTNNNACTNKVVLDGLTAGHTINAGVILAVDTCCRSYNRGCRSLGLFPYEPRRSYRLSPAVRLYSDVAVGTCAGRNLAPAVYGMAAAVRHSAIADPHRVRRNACGIGPECPSGTALHIATFSDTHKLFVGIPQVIFGNVHPTK